MFDRKGIQKELKSKSKQDSHGQSIFCRFVVDFGAILGAKIKQQSMNNEVGKQCKKRSNQSGQGNAKERLQHAAKLVVEALGKG